MKCICGRPVRRVTPEDHIDLEWTHADGDGHIFAGPMCDDGYLDDSGDWHDSAFAWPAAPQPCEHEWRTFRRIGGPPYGKCVRCGRLATTNHTSEQEN